MHVLKNYQSGQRANNQLEEIPASAKPLDLNATINELKTLVEWMRDHPSGNAGGGDYDDSALQSAISDLQTGKADVSDLDSFISLQTGGSISGTRAAAIGINNELSGSDSFATGDLNIVSGLNAFASGFNNKAEGAYSHSEGMQTRATNIASHSEGDHTSSFGYAAHAEGTLTFASGTAAHAEGYGTDASANNAHAEGASTYAQGVQSHAEGLDTVAYGQQSHAEGEGTIAQGENQHAGGQYNIANGSASSHSPTDYVWIIGNGTDDANRSDAAALQWNGVLKVVDLESFDGTKGLLLDTDKTKLDNLVIPDQLSDLTDDETHRLVTDTEKSTWNAKQPAMGSDDNYVTDAEKAALHAHSNKTALDAVSGTNTGDQTLSGLGGVAANVAITGATKTKVTYDSKGLVTGGSDATTVDIADSANKRYVTDAQLIVIGNTSGANSGDETTSTIKTKLGITTLSGSNTGDNAVNSLYSGLATSKQDTLVSATNIKTINGSSILGGGDLVVSGGSAPFAMYRLTAPFSNSTTTLQDVTGWAFPVTAGKIYRIEIIALYQTNTTTTGGKLGFYLPSGTGAVVGYLEGGISSATVATELKAPIYAIGASNLAGSFLLTSGVNVINTPHHIDGSLIFNCATSGEFRAQWSGEAATAAQLNTNSVLLVTVLN